ncbi:hypothetical protein [Sabulicella rubraurantiaca]|nr:hypothetical protein [Sabulicella rubraurantiaca]
MTIKNAPRGLPAHSGTSPAAPTVLRPGTGLSPAEIRQIVLDILG